MFSLQEKVIVVTGGNGLLGSEMVRRMQAAGATVLSADIQADTHQEGQIRLDITDENSVNDAISQVLSKYGKIDGWVNNAYPRTADWGAKFEQIKFESWRKNVDMHLNGYFLCCQRVLEQMKQAGKGSLVNMASIYGIVGPDFLIYEGTEMTTPAAYAAIKGGLVNLTRYLASYYGPSHLRVNTVSPGGIFDNQNPDFVANYERKVPLKKMGTPPDIAAAVHFLMSDEAGYITGHNLVVDGGWSAI
ncbi:MAG: SDR family oxidoreductase [Bacteroidetes bacterium]|nr:SDR family oxidoreductase [Bacteroidota bacterium]